MIRAHDWWFPNHERHLQAWLSGPKSGMILNGRPAYQGWKQQALMARCANFRTAIDVGAHVGLFSFNFAHRFERVFAFEPVVEHRECFKANVQLDNVYLRDVALGSAFGYISMNTEEGSSGNSTVAGAGDIPMVTLDSCDIQRVDCVKIDAEGYEENILRGGTQTILRDRPVIMVEQKGDMATRFGLEPLGAVAFLQSLGYAIAEESAGDYIMVPE